MTKDVLVTIKGLQSLEETSDAEEVELVAKGDYYFKNGHHYIFFEERIEALQSQRKTVLKSQETVWRLRKKVLPMYK